MAEGNTNNQYEVLSPWAEADPVPLKGITPRVTDLNSKKIGLFTIAYKHASARINGVIERKMKEKFPTAEFSYYYRYRGADFDDNKDRIGTVFNLEEEKKALDEFEEWVKEGDTVVGAVGD